MTSPNKQADPAPASETAKASAPKRLVSLDVLRGFDMFWIVGAGSLVHGLRGLSDAAPVALVAEQLEHAKWEGFNFFDLIFPLFVFITGASLSFSLSRSLREHGRAATIKKILKRAFILYLFGLFYYAGNKWVGDSLRFVGVLQRLAFCYAVTGILFSLLKLRGLIIAFATCLIGYWALLTFVPVPGAGAGNFTLHNNLSDYIDSVALPGAKYNGTSDPEGLLSHIPAVASCLMGLFAGMLIRHKETEPMKKVRILVGAGAASVVLGWLWHLQFPVIKSIWTSSFVLVAGGYSLLMLAFFYWFIDIRGVQGWIKPFLWIGMNPITIYMAFNLIPFNTIARRVVKGPVADALGSAAPLVHSLLVLGMGLLIVRFLYQRKIFLKV